MADEYYITYYPLNMQKRRVACKTIRSKMLEAFRLIMILILCK